MKTLIIQIKQGQKYSYTLNEMKGIRFIEYQPNSLKFKEVFSNFKNKDQFKHGIVDIQTKNLTIEMFDCCTIFNIFLNDRIMQFTRKTCEQIKFN